MAVAITLAFFAFAAPSFADMVIVASTDGFINSDGTIDDSGNFIKTQFGGGGVENRGIFEFDLSSIPDGAIIHSATFSGYTSLATSGSTVNLTGFVATAPTQIAGGDYDAAGTLVGVLSEPDGHIISDTNFSLTLGDLTEIQNALDSSKVFGIRSQMMTIHDSWNVDSLDFNPIPATLNPTLTVRFSSIPEPASAWVGVVAVCGIVLRRRRR